MKTTRGHIDGKWSSTGLKAFFKNQIDQAEERSFGGLTPTDDITPGGGSLIIKGMDDSDVEALTLRLKRVVLKVA